MEKVKVVKGYGPNFKQLMRTSPMFNSSDHVVIRITPAESEDQSSTEKIQGPLLSIGKGMGTDEDSCTLIVKFQKRFDHFYLVANYNTRERTGDGIIYTEAEFFLGNPIMRTMFTPAKLNP